MYVCLTSPENGLHFFDVKKVGMSCANAWSRFGWQDLNTISNAPFKIETVDHLGTYCHLKVSHLFNRYVVQSHGAVENAFPCTNLMLQVPAIRQTATDWIASRRSPDKSAPTFAKCVKISPVLSSRFSLHLQTQFWTHFSVFRQQAPPPRRQLMSQDRSKRQYEPQKGRGPYLITLAMCKLSELSCMLLER